MSGQRVRPIVARPMPSAADMAALGDIDPLHARLFAMRGLTDAGELDYGLAQLAPIGELEHIDAAAELVLANRDQKIIVVGDFDVDGATSTALVLRCMELRENFSGYGGGGQQREECDDRREDART